MQGRILTYISVFLALIVVLPVHEFAHAYVATKCGDNTPKLYNRLTLNPLAHFDVIGLVCFIVAHFGWAKPVPVNPNNFRKYKTGCFLVAIAGVCANFLLAFLVYPLMYLVSFIPQFGYFTYVIQLTLFYIYTYSLTFFVFNLIPVFPLDGFRVVDSFNKKKGKVYLFLRNYGIYVLYFLFFLSIISDYTGIYQLDILGIFISIISNYLSIPISMFWGLFF